MPARKFTDEQELEICRRYEAGESVAQLRGEFEASDRVIRNALRRNGVAARNGGLTPEEQLEVVALYDAGTLAQHIARKFRKTPSTIAAYLRKHGRNTRGRFISWTDEDLTDLRSGYRSDVPLQVLADTYKCSVDTVLATLRRLGEPRRHRRRKASPQLHTHKRRQLDEETAAQIAALYSQGLSYKDVAVTLHVSRRQVEKLIKTKGMSRSSAQARLAKKGLLPGWEAEADKLYAAGFTTEEVALRMGVDQRTASRALHRHGTAIRSISEAKGGVGVEKELEMCRLYLDKHGSPYIAKKYGVDMGTVLNVLRRHGVQARTLQEANNGSDTVTNALECSGRYTSIRECAFYLFELANHAGYSKPGISFDLDRRVDSEYGEEHLHLAFSTRQEAYFLEQAVLDATRGSASCPEELEGWIGHTEVRAMPAEDLVPIALRLADELEELGVWEFAARYVPMTAAQRAICQQRALAGAPAWPSS